MQCPNCGFENIPGLEACGVCSAVLAAPAEAPSVFPPRARDRAARDRMAATLARAHMRRIGRPNELVTARFGAGPSSGATRARLLLVCMVPGMGQRLVHGDVVLSRWHLSAAAAAVVLAALLYRSRASDILLLALIGLSIASIVACTDGWTERTVTDEARFRRRMATALMAVSAYAMAAVIVPLALMPIAQLQTVVRQTSTPVLRQGDTALFVRPGVPRRGDIVAGLQAGHVAGLGPVIGLPGDTVMVTPGGAVSVNGRVAPIALNGMGEPASDPAVVPLGEGEYWVPPNVRWQGTEAHGVTWAGTIAATGVMQRSSMVGRAVAIVAPPSRRRLIPRQMASDRER